MLLNTCECEYKRKNNEQDPHAINYKPNAPMGFIVPGHEVSLENKLFLNKLIGRQHFYLISRFKVNSLNTLILTEYFLHSREMFPFYPLGR